MTLLAILLGTLAAGIGSVWLAAWLSFGVVSRYTQHMLSLAAGALLATAFLHLLPEAFEAGVEPHNLFVTLLFGLLFFFLLDKAELWHHGHEHHHGEHHHGEHDHTHAHSDAHHDDHPHQQIPLRLDVSFEGEAHNGLAANVFVSRTLAEHPEVKPLTLVLKQVHADDDL